MEKYNFQEMSKLPELPDEIQKLINMNPFELEDTFDPTLLEKYLFYMPEIIRILGLHMANIKAIKRKIEFEIYLIENSNGGRLASKRSEILVELSYSIDAARFKNEQMRDAYVQSMDSYKEIIEELNSLRAELTEIESAIEIADKEVWKYINLNNNIDNISKLRTKMNNIL